MIKTINEKQNKGEMRTPSKAQETMEGADSKRTRRTKAIRNGTRRMEQSKHGQDTRPVKTESAQRGLQETREDEKQCRV